MSKGELLEGGVNLSDQRAVASWAMACWCDALGAVIGSITAARPAIRLQSPGEEKADSGEMGWWQHSFSLVVSPSIQVGTTAESWKGLGRAILEALGVNGASDSDLEMAWRDLLAQASNALAQHFAGELGEPVTSGDVVRGDVQGRDGGMSFGFVIDTGSAAFEGTAFFDPRFLASLQEAGLRARSRAAEEAQTKTPGSAGKGNSPTIELPVRVVLGRAQVPLRDIFKLNVGSVIELDRLVTDAAEIMAGEHMIGRGRVVVVNGNYGIKVTD
jgi:flagellar motor switch protein FliN/FliY